MGHTKNKLSTFSATFYSWFFKLTFSVNIFWCQEISIKGAHKMLVKLTPSFFLFALKPKRFFRLFCGKNFFKIVSRDMTSVFLLQWKKKLK